MAPKYQRIAVPVSERAANYRSSQFLSVLDQLPTEKCVEWPGDTSGDGYPVTRYNGHKTLAHRAIWTEIMGAIPDEHILDRVCRNKVCVNPRHCQPVSQAEHAKSHPGHNANKTHCPQGHPYSPENTKRYTTKDGGPARVCLTCRREQNKKIDARRKLERRLKRQAQLDRLRAAELAARATTKESK